MTRGWIEVCVFTCLAAAVHAAVIVGVAGPRGVPEGAGASGDAVLSLAAVPPALAARVKSWTQSPEVMQSDLPQPVAPQIAALSGDVPGGPDARPVPVDTPAQPMADAALPDMTLPVPEIPAEPLTVARAAPQAPSSPAPPGTRPEPRPAQVTAARVMPTVTRPITPDADASPAIAPTPPPRAAQRAAGQGAMASRGNDVAAQSTTARTAPSASAIATWGADIRGRIEARKTLPAGRWTPGRAMLRITVGRDGRLRAAAILQSSGDPRLDRAALAAVTRAGRLPRAPDGFESDAMRFDLPISFTR